MNAAPLSNADLGFFFEPHHHELAEHLRGIAGEVAAETDDARVAAAMGARWGLYRHLVPEGGPVDVRALCLVRELLGYASPLADAIFAVQGLGSYPVAVAGSDAQRQRLLPAYRSGERITGFALTEPEAGSDVASLRAVAERDGDGWRLRGDKTFISNVGIASDLVVFANADPAAGRRGITAFLLACDAPGVETGAIPLGIDHPIGSVRLEGAPAELLGEVGGGFKLAMKTLDTFRVSVGAAAVGMARRALEAALEHVRGRRQFGAPLADQQIVRSYLAEMATELDAARLLVLRAARARDAGAERVTSEAAMGKLYATEAAQRIIDKAVQLHGGRGVMSGQVVENLYRAIRPLRIYEGTSEIQRLIIGRALVEGGRA